MTFLSLFSGVGMFDLGLESLDKIKIVPAVMAEGEER